jgi:hypothetical protein
MLTFNNTYVFCLDDSFFGHNYKQQITDLILIGNENNIEKEPAKYTKNVYSIILPFFENLKHLSIASPSNENYPQSIYNYSNFYLYELPSTTFFSSTLTKLCVSVIQFNDCLTLLDGRLKQLTVFIVQVIYINSASITNPDRVSLYSIYI